MSGFGRVSFVWIVIISLAPFCGLSCRRHYSHKQDSWLYVAPEDLDLGEVWARPQFKWRVTFRNLSDKAVFVEDIHTSCRCTELERSSFRISPSSQMPVEFTLDFDSPLSSTSHEPRSFRLAVAATLHSAGEMTSQKWLLRGRVKQPLLLSNPDVEFVVDPVEPENETVRVRLTSALPIKTIASKSRHPVISSKVERVSDLAADLDFQLNGRWFSHRLHLLGSRIIAAKVTLETELVDDSEVISLAPDIPIQISTQCDVQVIPNSLSFGPNPLGTVDSDTVILRSRSGRPFSVRVLGDALETLRVCRDKMSGSQEAVFTISKKISEVGQEQDTVTFTVMDDRGIPYGVRLDIKSIGFGRGTDHEL